MSENEVTAPPVEEAPVESTPEVQPEQPAETPETPEAEIQEGVAELHQDLQQVREAVDDSETWNNGGPFKMDMPTFPENYKLYPKSYDIYLPKDQLHPVTDVSAVLERLKTPVPFTH